MIFAMLELRDIISSLLMLLPLVCWLIAERRGNRITRTSLGLLCMLVLCGGIYVAITASRETLSMHHAVLDQIDRALQEGDSSRAQHAIQTYRQTYKTTHSFKSAVWTTHWELARQPFLIRLTGRRTFLIRHPELVSCDVNGRGMTIEDEQGSHMFEMSLVEVMERTESPASSQGNGS